jgi:hypothetical protein
MPGVDRIERLPDYDHRNLKRSNTLHCLLNKVLYCIELRTGICIGSRYLLAALSCGRYPARFVVRRCNL